jgi:hypothetical protein
LSDTEPDSYGVIYLDGPLKGRDVPITNPQIALQVPMDSAGNAIEGTAAALDLNLRRVTYSFYPCQLFGIVMLLGSCRRKKPTPEMVFDSVITDYAKRAILQRPS